MKHLLLITAFLLPTAALAQGAPSHTQIDGQPGQTSAQSTPAPSPQIQADTEHAMHYTLPADFMPRAAAAIEDLESHDIHPPKAHGLSLPDMISQTTDIPGFAEILTAHGFTPDSFITGMTAFEMTLSATKGQVPAGLPVPSPTNLALLNTHPEEVNTLLQSMSPHH